MGFDQGGFSAPELQQPEEDLFSGGEVGGHSNGVSEGGAFFGSYTSLPVPAVVKAEPEPANDPRLLWSQRNAEQLKVKDAQEAEAKQAAISKAKEQISKFYEVRKKTVAGRKDTNRGSNLAAKAAPLSGTPWEKVVSLVNFSSGVHIKDVARFKATLKTVKAQGIKA
ncbi:MAG: hypothetical protein WDW38_007944 [Sanguina aurantia]